MDFADSPNESSIQPFEGTRAAQAVTNAADTEIAGSLIRKELILRNPSTNTLTFYVSTVAVPTAALCLAELLPGDRYVTDYQGIHYVRASGAGPESITRESKF